MNPYSTYDIVSICLYFVLCIALGIGTIHYYTKDNRLPIGIYLMLLYSYVILFFALALVTIDLAAGLYSAHTDPSSRREELYLNVLWRVVYWSIQVLAWIVIPLCQSYPYSGEFNFLRKMLMALWENVLFYLVIIAVAVIAIIATVISVLVYNSKHETKVSFKTEEIMGLGVSLSNAFGLTMLICFLGYGMVEFPRFLWYQSNLDRMLAYYEFQGSRLYDKVEDEYEELLKKLELVRKLKSKVKESDPFRPLVDQIIETAGDAINERARRDSENNEEELPNALKRKHLVNIHKDLLEAKRRHKKAEYQWEYLQQKAFWIEDVINSRNSPTKRIISPFRKASRLGMIEWFFYHYVRKHLFRFLAIAFVPFLLILCYSEFTPLLQKLTDKDVSVFGLLLRTMVDYRFVLQAFSLLLLILVAVLLYFGMFNVNLSNLYQLIPHHSDAASILYTALFLCRCVPALCFNFLQMVGVTHFDHVAFYEVMGTMKLSGLATIGDIGYYYSEYFPIMLLVVAVLTAFNIIDRLGALCGVERFKFSEKMNDEGVKEGKILLQRERRHKINKMREDNASDPDLESAELTLQINPNQITPEDLSDEDGDSEPTMNTNVKYSSSTAARLKNIYDKHKKKKKEQTSNKMSTSLGGSKWMNL